ncbi:MAG TPA: TraB/GumN family protein [Saprospiraceae bacterium]|nr:TraB/GumN family protein [Saprospiraceae bacterium]
MRSLLILLFFALATPFLKAQQLENALLWKISASDQTDQVSYLFGTIHMISDEHFYIPDTLISILKSSDSICFELNIDNPMEMMMGFYSMGDRLFLPDSKSLDDYLTDEQLALFDSHFNESALPASMLKRLKPLFTLAMLDSDSEELGDVKSYEMELSSLAMEYQVPTCGLEKMEDQLKIFDQIPLDEQIEQLMQAIEQPERTETQPMLDSLVYHYTNQNLNKLDEMISRQFYQKEQDYADVFLNDRNKNWVETIDLQMKNKRKCLYAVGAGHLGGKKGLIQLLRDKKYLVQPIMFNWPMPLSTND